MTTRKIITIAIMGLILYGSALMVYIMIDYLMRGEMLNALSLASFLIWSLWLIIKDAKAANKAAREGRIREVIIKQSSSGIKGLWEEEKEPPPKTEHWTFIPRGSRYEN